MTRLLFFQDSHVGIVLLISTSHDYDAPHRCLVAPQVLSYSYGSTGVDTEKPVLALCRAKFVSDFCAVKAGSIPFVPSRLCASPYFIWAGTKRAALSPESKARLLSPASSFAALNALSAETPAKIGI